MNHGTARLHAHAGATAAPGDRPGRGGWQAGQAQQPRAGAAPRTPHDVAWQRAPSHHSCQPPTTSPPQHARRSPGEARTPHLAPDPRERLLLPQPAVPTAVPMPALGRGRHSCLPPPRTDCPHAAVRGSVCHPGDTCRHQPLGPWWLPWGSWGPREVQAQPSTLSPMAGLGAIHPPTHSCPVTGEV